MLGFFVYTLVIGFGCYWIGRNEYQKEHYDSGFNSGYDYGYTQAKQEDHFLRSKQELERNIKASKGKKRIIRSI